MTQKLSADENYANERAAKFGDTIYHYCSLDTLLSILNHKELWFGSTASMNDSKEQRYFLENLENAIKEAIPKNKINVCNEFFGQIFKSLEHSYPYALCFSTLKDNAAQWERYADNACGISIGFNTRQIVKLFSSSTIYLSEVHYGDEIKKHKHYEIVLEYLLHDNLTCGFRSRKALIENILACSANHKHPSFSTESECRLTTMWELAFIKEAKYEFKFVNNTLKKILIIDLNSLCKNKNIDFEDIIDSITIGPRSKQNISELQEYLNEIDLNKLATKIYKSTCPLR